MTTRPTGAILTDPQHEDSGLRDRAQRRMLASSPRRPAQIGLLGGSALECAGLAYSLHRLRRWAAVAVASTQADPILSYSGAHRLDLVIATPGRLEAARRVARMQRLPLLLYATVDEARRLVDQTEIGLVVEPVAADELSVAVALALAGRIYRHPQLAGALSLSPRQRQILGLLAAGASTAQIAGALHVTPGHLRHLISDLYAQLGVSSSRTALVAWAQRAPLRVGGVL